MKIYVYVYIYSMCNTFNNSFLRSIPIRMDLNFVSLYTGEPCELNQFFLFVASTFKVHQAFF